MNAIAARQTVRRIAIAGSFLTLLTTFGCGSDDSSAEDPAASSSSSAGTPSAPAGGMDPEQLQEIQACLEAAGIDTQMPTGMPTDMPTDMPSDMPTGMPTDMPTDMPGGGGPGGQLNDPEVQAALEACGIELPEGRPSSPPS